MIKTLQAIFYITWIIIGIILIVGVFIGITTFPFESMGNMLNRGPFMDNEGMEGPSVGPSLDSGPSSRRSPGGPPEISEREREMLNQVLGKERADQILTWDDITSEEQRKMEEYYGQPPPNDKAR